MTIHKVFYGGDLRHIGTQHSRVAGRSSELVRYAGHLPRKHFVLPFEYDGGRDEWVRYAEMQGIFATGDELWTHELSADSRVETLFITNKRPAGLRDDVSGAITTPAKVKFGLYDGNTMVAETGEIDLSKVGVTILEFGATAKSATGKKDTNDDGVVNSADTPTTTLTARGAYLGNNGTIRMSVIDGSGLNSACFTAFVDVVDFLDVRGCSCVQAACESEYGEPICG